MGRRGSNRTLFDAKYVNGLADLWSLHPAKTRRLRDKPLFLLYRYSWDYDRLETHNKTRLRDERASIHNECQVMVANGDAFTLEGFATLLGQPLQNIYKWVRRGSIATVKVGPYRYLSAQCAHYFEKVFNDWFTVAAAAKRLNTPVTTIQSRIRRGSLYAVKCPDGLNRIPPEAVRKLVADANRSSMRLNEFAAFIGADYGAVHKAVKAGAIRVIRQNSRTCVSQEEAQKWHRLFNNLTQFEWLAPLVMPNGQKPATLTSKLTVKALRTTHETLSNLSKAQLLPFFPSSFTHTGRRSVQIRHFVRAYIFGLQQFLGGRRLTTKIARDYLELCKERNQIV